MTCVSKLFAHIEKENIHLQNFSHISSFEEQSKNSLYIIPLSTIVLLNAEAILLLSVLIYYSILATSQSHYIHM